MARLSKSKAFAIYEDNIVQAPENAESEHEEASEIGGNDGSATLEGDESISAIDHALQEHTIPEEARDGDGEDADDERRESTITSTTVSSFPDSYYMTEHEDAVDAYPMYTPPIIRTRFRRPESVKRMQMSSPPPYGYRSPRQSILGHSRSRAGTPRSVRLANTRGSPKTKKKVLEDDEEIEAMQYPLVLLHVSLLPLNAPWSLESMQELLSPNALENLLFLRSKLSETVLQRGILIPHPREEYELLEERLLEALELKEQRVTKCGHFHGPTARSSQASSTDSGRGSDSGIGSGSEIMDEDVCAICKSRIKDSRTALGSGNKKWMIKVYAANGLMRSSAWSAAWADMERVDVEIQPWISDDIRQKLDERRGQDETDQQERVEKQELRIREIVNERIRMMLAKTTPADVAPLHHEDSSATVDRHQHTIMESMRLEPPPRNPQSDSNLSTESKHLPQIYRPSQIPISVLLRNYLYLLAQDRKNLFIIGLSILVVYAIAYGTRTNGSMLEPARAATVQDAYLSTSLPELAEITPHPSAIHEDKGDETDPEISLWDILVSTDDADIEILPETDLTLASYDKQPKAGSTEDRLASEERFESMEDETTLSS